MNYQQIDAEKIKKVKEAEKKYADKGAPNNNSYSSIGLKRLSNGTYKTAHQGAMAASKRRESRKHDPVYNPQVRSTVPSVQPTQKSDWRKGTNYTPNYVNKNKVEQDDRKFEQMLSGTSKPKPQGVKKPSTRYTNNKSTVDDLLNKELPKYDEKYKKDFEEFYLYRHDMSDAVDWDEKTQEQIPTWQNLQKKMMKKYGWTEDEFNKKYGEYENYEYARQQKGKLEVDKYEAENHPGLASLMSVPMLVGSTFEGLGTAARGLGHLITDYADSKTNGMFSLGLDQLKGVLPELPSAPNPYGVNYDDWNVSSTAEKEYTRQKVAEGLADQSDDSWKEMALNAAGVDTGAIKAGAYNAGMGLVDLATNYVLGLGTPVGMGIASGAQNAAQNELHALERGIDPETASKLGLTTGVIAGLMNTVGLDSVMKSTAKTVAGQFLQGAAKEGLENTLEDIADMWADQLFNGKNSEAAQTIQYYVENGMSPKEAYEKTLQDYLKQEAISFTSGAAFGGIMAAGRGSIPSLVAPQPEVQGRVPDVVENARAQAERAQAEVERLREQIPETPVPTETQAAGESAPSETLNNAGMPKSVSDQIAEAIQKDNFTPITFTDTDGYTHLLTRSTRDGEKWQVSHLDETGRAVGHNAYANDADLLNKLKTDDKVGNLVEINTDNNILTQPEVTINDMVKNSGLFSKKDFEKALRTIDRNADTYGASKGDLIEAIMFNINEESSTGDLQVKVSPNTYESFRNKIGAESNSASPDSNVGEIKLVRNKETGEYTYGDYRIVKEGKSKYNILDADGNTVGNARTLNDVKTEIQKLQSGVGVETPETEIPAEPQNTPKATTQKAPSNYDIDSMMGDDGKEKFFVVETKPDGTEDFADGKFYDTEEEAQAALDAMNKPVEPTPEPKNEVPNVKKPKKQKSKPVPEVVETPKAETPKAEVPNVKPAEEDVEIPPEGPGEKVRSFSKRASNDEELPEEIRNIMGEDFYSVARNADTKAKADELFDPNNLTQTRSNFDQAVERLDPASSLLAYRLAKAYVDNGDYDAAVDVLHKVSENLTRGGQFTQAAKLAMLQNDPMAAARSYIRDLDSLNEWGRKKYKKKWNKIELSKEDLEGFNKIQKGDKEALSTYIDTLNAKYGKMIPANWWDKLVAGTKISMLLNPRTQVRNIGSNAALVPIRSMSDRVSALGQNAVHLFNKDFEVTQSLVGGTKEQKRIAGQIFDSKKAEILGENKMKDSVKSDILSHRQIFNDDYLARWIDEKTNGGLQRLNESLGSDGNQSTAETLQNLTYWLMGDFGDTPFVKKNFVNRLASYMKAQGITNIDDVPDDAINIAIEEALKATFKDDNAFTQALQGIKGKSGKLGEVALPFVKTPANLAMRAVDYSPFGVINTIRKAKSGADLSRVIDDLSKNLTGSAMIMLGYALRNAGIITGSYSDDKNEAAFQKQQGMLENAFKIGGKYFNYDWLQPGGTPLLLGSTLYDAIKLSDKENAGFADYINAGWNGMLNVGNAILESSPLQTAADLLGGSQYDKGGIAGNVANEVLEFPQRLIPSVLGATARTVDPTYRDTYVSDSSLTGMLGNLARSSMAKIPFLSKLLPASYNSWGFERRRNDDSVGGNLLGAASQYILPGSMGNDQTTGLDNEIQRLYDATGMSEVFPHKAPNQVNLGSQGYITLTPQQHSDYQREMGQQSFEYAKNLMGNAQFEKLTDEQKVDALNSAYGLAENLAKEKVFDYHTEKVDTIEKIAKTRGAAGVTDYLIASQKAKELDMGVNDYLKYEQEWKGGAEQYKKDKDAGEKLDLTPREYADAEKSYQGGAVQYSRDKKKAESLGMNMSDFIKKNEDYEGGAVQYAEDKQQARELGFVNSDNSVNVDQYNKAVEVVGNDRNKLYDYQSFKAQGYTKRSEMVPALEGMSGFTDDDKGRILAKNVSSISDAAQGMQDQFGDKGLYYYYLIFDKADANHNNNLSKKEKESFFANKNNYSNLSFLTQDMLNYLNAYMK